MKQLKEFKQILKETADNFSISMSKNASLSENQSLDKQNYRPEERDLHFIWRWSLLLK